MASNQFALAFVELLDANDSELRTPQFVMIKGRKHRAIISEMVFDDENAPGGIAEAGGFRVQVLKSGFADKPEKGDTIEVRNQKLEVIGPVTENNECVYEVIAGDPLAGER